MENETIEISIAECPIEEEQTQEQFSQQLQEHYIPVEELPQQSLSEEKVLEELTILEGRTETVSSEQLDEKRSSDFKHSSSQFFHFVRLMQLFPNVHPATLHTVMTVCKNDFFTAVDRLLYAKRCKEIYQSRKSMYEYTQKHNRCVPYPCMGPCTQNVQYIRQPVVKMDSKKISSKGKNKGEKSIMINQFQHVQQQQGQESPFLLQCNVPLRPLSPVNPQDLTANNTTEEGN